MLAHKDRIELMIKKELQRDTPHIDDIEDLVKFGNAKHICPYYLQ